MKESVGETLDISRASEASSKQIREMKLADGNHKVEHFTLGSNNPGWIKVLKTFVRRLRVSSAMVHVSSVDQNTK